MKSRPANTSPSALKVRSDLPGLKASEKTTQRNASRNELPDGRPEEARDRPCRRASLSSEIFRSGSDLSTARAMRKKTSSQSSAAARTLNYLTETTCLQYADLGEEVEDVHSSYERTRQRRLKALKRVYGKSSRSSKTSQTTSASSPYMTPSRRRKTSRASRRSMKPSL